MNIATVLVRSTTKYKSNTTLSIAKSKKGRPKYITKISLALSDASKLLLPDSESHP